MIRVGSATVGQKCSRRSPRSRQKGSPMIRVVVGAMAVALSLVALDGEWAQLVYSPSQDPMAGARVFATKGCEKCHSINGVGGKIGPDLAKNTRTHSFLDVAPGPWKPLPR